MVVNRKKLLHWAGVTQLLVTLFSSSLVLLFLQYPSLAHCAA